MKAVLIEECTRSLKLLLNFSTKLNKKNLLKHISKTLKNHLLLFVFQNIRKALGDSFKHLTNLSTTKIVF